MQTALFYGSDQWADEMQLDCISETLMVALFYGSCFYCVGALPDWCLNVGSYSPLDSSYVLVQRSRRGQLFMYFNDERMKKSEIK